MEDVQVPLGDDAAINVWHRPPASGFDTMVLVHGLTGTSRLWIPVLASLPSEMGVIAPDLRGRGASWEAPPPYDLQTLAADVSHVITHLHPDSKVVGVGYSMGAWVMALLAGSDAETISRAVLLDGGIPVPIDSNLTPDENLDRMVGPSLRRLEITFTDIDDYFDYHRSWPTLEGRWHPAIEAVLRYDVVDDPNGLRVRANAEAMRVGGFDMAINPETNSAGLRVRVSTTLVVVDRGMQDEPGGFVPEDSARAVSAANPALTVELWTGLNHDTLVLGEGAPLVAQAATEARHEAGN